MTAVSRRFALPLVLLMTPAAFAVVTAYVSPRQVDDCANPELLMDVNSMGYVLAAIDIQGSREVEGTLQPLRATETPLDFLIIRSWGLPRLFLHPTARSELQPDRHEIEWVQVNGHRLPIHKVRQKVARGVSFAAYLFAYEGEPVEGPFTTRIRKAFAEFLGGQRPIRMFAVSGKAGRLYASNAERRAVEWITSAWEHYDSVCSR